MRMLYSSHPALAGEGGWIIVVVGRQAQDDTRLITAIEWVARGIQQAGVQDETHTFSKLRGLPETDAGSVKFQVRGISKSQARSEGAERTQRLGDLHVLPDEILLLVLSFLHPFALLNLHLVNSTYRDFVRAEIDWGKFWGSDTKGTGPAATTQFVSAFKASPDGTLTMLCDSFQRLFNADEKMELDEVRSMAVVGRPITYRGPIKFPQVLKIMTQFRFDQLLANEQQLNDGIDKEVFNWSRSITDHPHFKIEAEIFIQRLLDQALCLAEKGENLESLALEEWLPDQTPNLRSVRSKVRVAEYMSALIQDRRTLCKSCRSLAPLLLRHARCTNSSYTRLKYAYDVLDLDRILEREHVVDCPEEARLSSEVAGLMFHSAVRHLEALDFTYVRSEVEVSMQLARRAVVQLDRRLYDRLIRKIEDRLEGMNTCNVTTCSSDGSIG